MLFVIYLTDNPSPDVLSKHKVTSEYSPLYNNLTLILPTILSITAIFAATIAVTVYCKTRMQAFSFSEDDKIWEFVTFM